ncbi:hypothetical protein [Cuniculiplasma divulgatum]|uniref:Multipass membrane protein n=1 Tax=Cuniculiplasma divulgatum TaxID=1673428 RepID=A0A1N5V069_9ARCH|nr:hypothetical protein [Cuniculiplasma divulgatum]SIM65645.1 multipass membrane protein [Cuniculiplasma divulgatum]
MTEKLSKLNILLPVLISIIVLYLVSPLILKSEDFVTLLSIVLLLGLFISGSFYTRAGSVVGIIFLLFIISTAYLQSISTGGSYTVTISFITLYVGIMSFSTWLFVIVNKKVVEPIRSRGSRTQEKEIFDVINDLEFLESP